MKKIKKKICSAAALTLGAALLLAGCGSEDGGQKEIKKLKIGISVYDQYDTFVSEIVSYLQAYAKEKEKDWGISITLDVENANGSQMIQNDQMDGFIRDDMDIACINLVDRTDASTIVEKAQASNVPVIFFNRELVEEDLERWDQLYYVGADAFESGKMQGEILVEECKKNFSKIDKNGDGILQYVMLEGEAGHNDSMVRSMSVISEITDRGYLVEKLSDEIANWNRDQAANKMKQFMEKFDDEIEVVLANNDDMALGAIDALTAAGLSTKDENWPVVLGIDGTTVGLEAVEDGKMLGTVLNDAKGQARGMLELAYSIVSENSLPEEFELLDGKYIRMPYQIVTVDNLGEIQMKLMK
ncbi:galactose ABC transporter substrate-binding protein [Ruminococcus sp. 5_1_39BFAA]|uniref:galactose ABC transporter substrate-binding protein n=1 Tax=Ruminococcus sp. 5_1_39BFAA TaxID=457412 RepID=UPI003563C0EE